LAAGAGAFAAGAFSAFLAQPARTAATSKTMKTGPLRIGFTLVGGGMAKSRR
jgi:hypothetical protein